MGGGTMQKQRKEEHENSIRWEDPEDAFGWSTESRKNTERIRGH